MVENQNHLIDTINNLIRRINNLFLEKKITVFKTGLAEPKIKLTKLSLTHRFLRSLYMKFILSLLISVIFSVVVISAPVCTMDENGNYSCTYELPDAESIDTYLTGTYEIVIVENKKKTLLKIDADMGYIFYNEKTKKIPDSNISELIDDLYSIEEKQDGDVTIVITTSDGEELTFNTNTDEKRSLEKVIEKAFKESGE